MRSTLHLVKLARAGARGRDWYQRGMKTVAEIAAKHFVPLHYAAAVIAITSPRQTLAGCLRLTNQYLATESTVGMLASVRKGLEHYHKTGGIGTRRDRARKTRAYRDALCGDEEAIVLDVWMAAALEVSPDQLSKNQALYLEAERRVRRAAAVLKWTPAQTQAAIWCAVQKSDSIRYL